MNSFDLPNPLVKHHLKKPMRCTCGSVSTLEVSYPLDPKTGKFGPPEIEPCLICKKRQKLCLPCEYQLVPGGHVEEEIGGSDLGRSYRKVWREGYTMPCPRCINSGIVGAAVTRENGPDCGSCGGEGRTICTACNGTGRQKRCLILSESCPTCEGTGKRPCTGCDGSGRGWIIECGWVAARTQSPSVQAGLSLWRERT